MILRHLLLILAVSAGWETLFLRHGISVIDEGWTLYAAMHLHAGGTLYDEVFFVFPPGHLLAAWIAYGVDPPGLHFSRILYAAFATAACLALYALGRRVMPPRYALLGALLLAVAAPQSHLTHHLFGYRYLVFSALALVCFAQRLDSDHRRWLLFAGMLTGVAVCFRLTPAFAVACGIGVGILVSRRGWLHDGATYAAGVLAVAVPVVAWFAAPVGLETLWREIVVRAVVMTERQALPMPDLALAEWSRDALRDWFVAFQFRAYALLLAVYLAVLAIRLARSLTARAPFRETVLLAVVVWGAVYFSRTLGRSDFGHLDSALPPVCLLLGHALHTGFSTLETRGHARARASRVALIALVGAAWIVLPGGDRMLSSERRGTHPLASAGGVTALTAKGWANNMDVRVQALRSLSAPGQTILDLTDAPLLYVLADRLGPGHFDIVIPGTFLDAEEEKRFVARLREHPPALIVWPIDPFDDLPERGVSRTAPRLLRWISRNYEYVDTRELSIVWPKRAPGDGSADRAVVP